MTVTVDAAQLDGYADQLERNSGLFIAPLRDYTTAHCLDTTGMTGLLAPARPVVETAGDSIISLLTSAERNLFQVATNLRAAADGYRAGDTRAAERIWMTLAEWAPTVQVDTYDDPRHSGDFRDPFVPRPTAPPAGDSFARLVAEATQHIDTIDQWLHRFARISLADQVLPWISGNWETLRTNAAAYRALAGPDGLPAIGANLAYGMDSVSASWDSPAGARFEAVIRAGWLPALDALRHLCELHEEAFEWIAQQSENTLRTLVLLIEVVKLWVIDKVLRVVRLARLAGTAAGAKALWDELVDLVAEVLAVRDQIDLLFDVLRMAIAASREAVALAGSEADVIEDLWGHRLGPIASG